MELLPIFQWLLVCLIIGVAGRRVGAWLFPDFPYVGTSFAIPIGLLIIALPTYWVGHISLAAGMLVGFLLLVLLALLLGSPQMHAQDRREWAIPLSVFVIAFVLFLFVRASRPGIVPAGGEKFLDFSLLKAVLRAEALPAEDPWFAGRPVRYYYGGPLVVGILTEFTRIPARIAYNLALPTFYATIAVAAYGVSARLAAVRDRSTVAAGLTGAVLMALAGPLSSFGRALLGLLPRDIAIKYGRALVVGIRMHHPEAIDTVRFLAEDPLSGFSAWEARYVIPETPNVFPMWTYLNGDLRPHMLDLPFLLLLVALLAAIYTSANSRRRRILVFGVVPAVTGLAAHINTWSLPMAVGLVALVLVTDQTPPRDLLPEPLSDRLPSASIRGVETLTRFLIAIGIAGIVGVMAAALAAPSLLHSPINQGIGFLPPRSPIEPFLLFHGGFVLLFGLAFLPELIDRTGIRVVGFSSLAVLVVVWLLPIPNIGAAVLAAGIAVGGLALARWDGSKGFTAVLIVAGAGLLVVSELAYAKVYPFDPNAPRWNTIYKLYMHVWTLWAPAAGVAAVAVIDRATKAFRSGSGLRFSHVRAGLSAVIVVGVLLATSTYGILGTGAMLAPLAEDPKSLHLDGTAYVADSHPQEQPIIEWLNEREGTPTVVAKPGRNPYTWSNPLSSLTGVPTVVGWNHQIGYRGEEAYERRANDVNILYKTEKPETRAAILEMYEVDYVYIGPTEREAYNVRPQQLLKHDAYTVAMATENATLIAVNRSQLPESEAQYPKNHSNQENSV